MFKLQRLEITGFKSFADYTEIVFTGSGITAVVGPNGCGKSNVSDCIAWVLGEQRAKSLRGAEMKDVVFQGTKNRKPSGMAEVVLHLVRSEDAIDIEADELGDIDETLNELDEHAVDVDALEAETIEEPGEPVVAEDAVHTNGNGYHDAELDVEKVQAAQVGSVQTVERVVKTKRHWRPRSFALDFAPGEAVSVTRRLYLSGESEYQLNGKTCRLRDIQDLFAGTGLSGAHYAIIEQGRIGQILSAKPADRRNLIEEAAGISKFRTRQRAAEARLESAKSNLGRISDIVSEIEKQANSLRRQAGKTRRYIALQEEFRGLLRKLFAAEGRHLTALIDELATSLDAAKRTEEDFVATVAAKEEEFRLATQDARTADEKLAEVRRIHAVRTARLACEALETAWIKLEVIGDQTTLLPDNEQTLEAAKILVKEGFIVLPYFTDDLIMARKLLDAGCPAVMPLAAPIGSGMGVQNPSNLRIMREQLPDATIIVDAGVGVPSDASIAMELGADALLMNTSIAEAGDPARMATAMKLAVEAGRLAYLSGRMPKRLYASASSPIQGAIK